MQRSEMAAYSVVCGVDVGKSSHHACAMRPGDDEPLLSRELGAGAGEARALVAELGGPEGVLFVVDQPGGFGEPLVRELLSAGAAVAQMPPARFAEASGLFGEDKGDARDARALAEASAALPRLVDPVAAPGGALARGGEAARLRASLVRERTACSNRLHALLHRLDPGLEAFFAGGALRTSFALAVIGRWGGPAGLAREGREGVRAWVGEQRGMGPAAQARVDGLFEALGGRRGSLPAGVGEVAEAEAGRLARAIAELNASVAELDAVVAEAAAASPEARLLSTLDGVGPVYSVTIAAEVGDASRFPDAAHLASYAGVAPVRRESGTSVRATRKRRGGNRRLKNALVESAAIACRREGTWEAGLYARLRARGKGHFQALLVVARRRVDVIFRMLSDGVAYDPALMAA